MPLSLKGRLLCAGLATLAVAWSGSATAVTKLTYGSYLPATHVIHEKGLLPFFKRVEQDTNGSLTWELFSGGAMGGPKEALQTIEDDVVDSAIIVDVYIKRDVPVSVTIADVGLLVDDPLVFAAATNEAYLIDCPQCAAETKKHNKIALSRNSTGIYNIMCTSPIHTLEGLHGVKVRSAGRHGVLMKELGATPVGITTAEMYEALQRGQADCTTGSTAWLNAYGLKDVIKAVIDYPIGAYIGGEGMNMNADRWNSLTDAERMAIRKNLPKLVSDTVFAYMAEGDLAREEAIKNNGLQVLEADEPLKNAIDKFRQGEVQVSIDKAREAGVKDPERILNHFMASVEKWRKIVADIGRDKEKYEEALWREIFSKATP
ncbi:MAG: C4-dicarboxylate TRAP transporter substrate-binding protein [Alphaproteobacteria bacterium]|nr:C4-dicarboxylate TRAP transporter substrate-binding protein [Alphaproteobacteria bacterium]MCB9928619.1 C4-dicarboxylate TRAP transporter substrate-binding protein [Alphaproteobacteria bacterium]